MNWLKQSAIAFDQFLNALLFAGFADETLSARAHRRAVEGDSYFWSFAEIIIDLIFFWQVNPNHCEGSYQAELKRKHLPREYHDTDSQ